MTVSVTPVTEYKPKNTGYVKTTLERRSEATKEAQAKWAKDHPDKLPGYSFKMNSWKSWSRQASPSEAFREGWDRIFNKKKEDADFAVPGAEESLSVVSELRPSDHPAEGSAGGGHQTG